MKIELANGKTIDMPIERYIDLTDEEYEDFISRMLALDAGYNISDPFTNIYEPLNVISIEDIDIENLPSETIDDIQREIEEDD
jgi:hypothetical protein